MIEIKVTLFIVNLILGFVMNVFTIIKIRDYYILSRNLHNKVFKENSMEFYLLFLDSIICIMSVIMSVIPLYFIVLYYYNFILDSMYEEMKELDDMYNELHK